MGLSRDLPAWIGLGVAGFILFDAIFNKGCKHWIPIFDIFEGCGCGSMNIFGQGAVNACEEYVSNIKPGTGFGIDRSFFRQNFIGELGGKYGPLDEQGLREFIGETASKKSKQSTTHVEKLINEFVGRFGIGTSGTRSGRDSGLTSGGKSGAPFGGGSSGAPSILRPPSRVTPQGSGTDPFGSLSRMIDEAQKTKERGGQATLDDLIVQAQKGNKVRPFRLGQTEDILSGKSKPIPTLSELIDQVISGAGPVRKFDRQPPPEDIIGNIVRGWGILTKNFEDTIARLANPNLPIEQRLFAPSAIEIPGIRGGTRVFIKP